MNAHPLRFAVSLQNDRPIAEIVEQARLAESLGYPEIWTNENGHYRGIFTVASTIATTTSTSSSDDAAASFMRSPKAVRGLCNPGVSTKTT